MEYCVALATQPLYLYSTLVISSKHHRPPYPPYTLTDHGLFCMDRVESVKNLEHARGAANEAFSFLKALARALNEFESKANLAFTSTCPHCSFTLASRFIDYLYCIPTVV